MYEVLKLCSTRPCRAVGDCQVTTAAADETSRTTAVEAIRQVADMCDIHHDATAADNRREFRQAGGLPALLEFLGPVRLVLRPLLPPPAAHAQDHAQEAPHAAATSMFRHTTNAETCSGQLYAHFCRWNSCRIQAPSGTMRDSAVVRWAAEVLGMLVAHDEEAREQTVATGGVDKLRALLAGAGDSAQAGPDTVQREAVRHFSYF